MIIKVESSNKLLASADNLYLTGLQPIINQNDATNISSAIKNSIPAPDKRDSIRKELSNGFKYTFSFTETSNSSYLVFKQEGEISSIQTTNITSYEFKLNDNIVSIPFSVNYDDALVVSIERTNLSTPAELSIEASEFNVQDIAVNVDDDFSQFDGYEIDINPDMNITYNEFDSGFSIETNTSIAQLQADSIIGTPAFSTDDIGREVILELPGGNQTVKITAFNSISNVSIDQLPNETAQGISFKYKRISSISNCGTLGGAFEENDSTLQPHIYKGACNGHDAIQFTQGPRLVFNKLHPNEFTLFVVVKSFDERTSGTVANAICGDMSSSAGFWLIGEWGNPAENSISTYGRFYWSINVTAFSNKTIRDKFHLITLRFKRNQADMRIDDETIISFTPIENLISHSPANQLTVGNVSPTYPYTGRMLITRLLIYNSYKNDNETAIINDILKSNYQL